MHYYSSITESKRDGLKKMLTNRFKTTKMIKLRYRISKKLHFSSIRPSKFQNVRYLKKS